jgi:hypothetical protein
MIGCNVAIFVISAINYNIHFVTFYESYYRGLHNTIWCVLISILAVSIISKTILDIIILSKAHAVYLFFNLTQSVDHSKISEILNQLKATRVTMMKTEETVLNYTPGMHSTTNRHSKIENSQI